MLTIKQKINIALKILLSKTDNINIDEVINGYKVIDHIKKGVACDNAIAVRTGCENNAEYCLSRTHLKIETINDDHVHVCKSCCEKLLGKIHSFR